MFRLKFVHKDASRVLALAFALVLVFATACTPSRTPVSAPSSQAELLPVTGAKDDSAPPAQKVDLNATSGQQVAADRMYLESDAWLVKDANGWHIATHRNLAPSQPQSPAVDRIYLESDYWLVREAGAWRVVPSRSQVRVQAKILDIHKQYLGGGFWLETWAQGGQVVQEGSR